MEVHDQKFDKNFEIIIYPSPYMSFSRNIFGKLVLLMPNSYEHTIIIDSKPTPETHHFLVAFLDELIPSFPIPCEEYKSWEIFWNTHESCENYVYSKIFFGKDEYKYLDDDFYDYKLKSILENSTYPLKITLQVHEKRKDDCQTILRYLYFPKGKLTGKEVQEYYIRECL